MSNFSFWKACRVWAQMWSQPPASTDLGALMWAAQKPGRGGRWRQCGGSIVGQNRGGPPWGSMRGPLWQSPRKPLKGHAPVPWIAQKCPGSIFWKIRRKTTEYRLNPVRRKINKKYLFNKAPDLDCLLSRTIWSNLSPGATICVCIRFYHSQCTCPYLILLEPSPNLSR